MMKDLTSQDGNAAKAKRRRSIAIALILGALVVAFYAATIVHMGSGVLNRPL